MDFASQRTTCKSAVKHFPVHQYSVVSFTFSAPFKTIGLKTGYRFNCESCRIFQYLSWTDSINSSLSTIYFQMIPFSEYLTTSLREVQSFWITITTSPLLLPIHPVWLGIGTVPFEATTQVVKLIFFVFGFKRQLPYKNYQQTKFEPQHNKTNKMTCASSEDSDQHGHPPSLIRAFAVRMKKHWVLSYPLSALRRSESSLGAQIILLVLSCGGSNEARANMKGIGSIVAEYINIFGGPQEVF